MHQNEETGLKGDMRAYVSKVLGIIKRMENGQVFSTREIAEMIDPNVSSLKIHLILEKLERKRNLKHLGVYDSQNQEFARI